MLHVLRQPAGRYFCFLPVLLIFVQSGSLKAQSREVVNLRSDWKFAKGHYADAPQKDFNDAAWQPITVPHDWAIGGPFILDGDGSTGKLPWKGEGWYRRPLDIPASYSGKRIYLVFDGVMAFPKIYINGILAGSWDYGYNSFYLDITDHLEFGGKNILAVHADTRLHDSRWYPGAGIYRKVQMIIVHPLHVHLWGTQITTPIVKANMAMVNIISRIGNYSGTDEADISLEHTIISPARKEITSTVVKSSLRAGSSKDLEATLTLPNPQRWDIDQGLLYVLKTVVKKGTQIVDQTETAFGVRTIRFTADDGFYLNDRRVQLKGVNLHHDHGPLGAAFYPRAMERQLEILKDMGCNAVRNSHNTAAPELLEMCDRMGILVFNEIFDKYDGKADILDETDFEEFTRRNIKNFVARDRNHPSVFLWSVGNEIGDVQWNINGGFAKLRLMINEVRRHDHTRPVTLVCDSRNSARLRHFDFYDVHSWNYGRRYDLARQLEPNKAVIISESASTVSTRGFYEWPLPEKKTDFTKSLQVSSYDLHAPEWAEIADDDFMWQQDENYIAGEFVWTGFDYLGEPTPYDNRSVKNMGMTDKEASVSSYFGILDLTGMPKDRFYLYRSYWNTRDTTIHVLPHWNWKGKEGQNIPVFVYTSGDCAELYLNGQSQGMKCKIPGSQNSTERFRLMWNNVVYAPGELKVIAYREGVKLGETFMKTTDVPYRLKLTPDRSRIKGDGMDLAYVLIEALDKFGNVHPLADHTVELNVTGQGAIAGVGNGNPQSMESFQSNRIRLFYGKAMVILRSDAGQGEIEITATSKGLIQDIASITVE